jgi:hypothetical protein
VLAALDATAAAFGITRAAALEDAVRLWLKPVIPPQGVRPE